MTERDRHFMQLALAQAREAAAQGEVPVGAVVVRNDQVVAQAHNAPVGLQDPTAHAEVRALRAAAQAVGNYRLEDCTLYVTLEPCAMCSGAMLHARLRRVVFGAQEPRTGAAGSVLDVFASPLNHQTQVVGGVMADDCAALLQDFFGARRLARQQTRTPLRDDALRTPDACFAGFDLPQHLSCHASDWPSLQGWRLHWFDSRAEAEQGSDRPVTLYLHGPKSWSAAYATVLKADGACIALDWLGFGLSDKPKKEAACGPERQAAVLADFLARHPVAEIVAPSSVAPILALLQARDGMGGAHGTPLAWPPLRWMAEPFLPEALARAPYPDRGHEAARRAWPTI